MLELHHWEPNTYFLKPLIALKEKQAPFTSRWFDAQALEQFAPSFPTNTEAGLHLEREGPLLIHDGTLISNSFFMLEYIADALPGPELYPGDAYQHYRARAWGQVLTAVGADINILGCAQHLAPALAKEDPALLRQRLAAIEPLERRQSWLAFLEGRYDAKVLETIRGRLRFPLKRLEDTLATSRWLAGEAYSVADIDAFSLLNALPTLAPEILNDQATPHLMDFLNRMHARKAVREALAMSRTGRPQEAFVPGAEPSRWG